VENLVATKEVQCLPPDTVVRQAGQPKTKQLCLEREEDHTACVHGKRIK
jgi:hypothetical protein